MANSDLVQALKRGLDILRIIGNAEHGLRLCEIVPKLDIKPPAVHNLLRTLIHCRFVEKTEDNRYRLGAAACNLTCQYDNKPFLAKIETAILDIGKVFAESIITYSEVRNGQIKILRRLNYFHPGLIQVPQNKYLKLYVTASGLAVLAYAKAEEVNALRMENSFYEAGIQLWKDIENLETCLEEAKTVGYVLFPYNEPDITKLALPVWGVNGEFTGVIGIRMHTPEKFDKERIKTIQKILQDTLNSTGIKFK